MTYAFLQQYWWFVVSLLGSLLVFLLFVQGINSMISQLARTRDERQLVIATTGRRWEITFTTLVTFGGAFFASFPLFYSTSFGGAYWVWMAILLTFILQAVSYEFQGKMGNILGERTFQGFLVLNGVAGPLLLGVAVSTFFCGANFVVDKMRLVEMGNPVVSHWVSPWGGLEAVANPWNVLFGLAVLFLTRTLGALYIINNVSHDAIRQRARCQLRINLVAFLVCFLPSLGHILLMDGVAAHPATGAMAVEPFKYLANLSALKPVAVLLLAGVAAFLFGAVTTAVDNHRNRGIWPAGAGAIAVVLALLLLAGWNNTAYYPSLADLQSSLTIANSSSSEFTLRTMAVVSLLVPFVVAYICYTWRKLER